MSRPALLIAEPPLQVLPSLAKAIGLNEAIILQQIQYWTALEMGEVHDNRRWIYNSVEDWRKQFPFWSDNTIQRALQSLRDKGLLDARKLSSDKWRHTLYYSINYNKLQDCITPEWGKGFCKNEESITPDWDNGNTPNCGIALPQNGVIIPTENTQRLRTETTPENTSLASPSDSPTNGADDSNLQVIGKKSPKPLTPEAWEKMQEAMQAPAKAPSLNAIRASQRYRELTESEGIDLAVAAQPEIAAQPEPAVQSAAKAPQGSRIPDDFTPSEKMRQLAIERFPGVDLLEETDKFCDYWKSQAGAKARKADWQLTWKTWIRTAHERLEKPRASQYPQRPLKRNDGPAIAASNTDSGREVRRMLDAMTPAQRERFERQKNTHAMFDELDSAITQGGTL